MLLPESGEEESPHVPIRKLRQRNCPKGQASLIKSSTRNIFGTHGSLSNPPEVPEPQTNGKHRGGSMPFRNNIKSNNSMATESKKGQYKTDLNNNIPTKTTNSKKL
jgi:hypothetical protein